MRRISAIVLAVASLGFVGMGSGSAADMAMPLKTPMVAAPVPFSWTGFYIGGNVGAGWGTVEPTVLANPAIPLAANLTLGTVSPSGFVGGGQLGFNWQTGWVVWGVEGDFDGAGIKGTTQCFVGATCSSNTNWLATASGRVGGVVLDRILAYVKGGGAWENTNYSGTDVLGLVAFPGATVSATSTRAGWLLGMGVEYAFTNNWTGFIEYDYMDFGSQTINFPFAGAVFGANMADKLNEVKAGVNYKF